MTMRASPEEICARSPGTLREFRAPGEKDGGKTHGVEYRLEPLEMLARQNFGRRHQRRLAPGLRDMRHGERRDDGLAGADIALHQPQHALIG